MSNTGPIQKELNSNNLELEDMINSNDTHLETKPGNTEDGSLESEGTPAEESISTAVGVMAGINSTPTRAIPTCHKFQKLAPELSLVCYGFAAKLNRYLISQSDLRQSCRPDI